MMNGLEGKTEEKVVICYANRAVTNGGGGGKEPLLNVGGGGGM